MMPAQWMVFMLYTGFLAWEDSRDKEVSLTLIGAGAGTGVCFRILEIVQGSDAGSVLLTCLLSLVWGTLLLLISRLSRGALGKGDGLCFISFAFWWDFGRIFILLFMALLLSAVVGVLLMLLKKRGRKDSLPFLPFLWAASWVLPFLSDTGPV